MANELATVERAEIMPRDEWNTLQEQAKMALASGFFPKAIRTPAQATAVVLCGRELGIGPMTSLRTINIIEGKTCMSADLIAALVFRRVPGAVLRVVESTDARCIVEAARPGQKPTVYTFTIQDAKTAGLTGKDNWKKYPRPMLRARCVTEACRGTFPDASCGIYDPDELGAVTSPEGDVVTMPASVTQEAPQVDESAAFVAACLESMGAAEEADDLNAIADEIVKRKKTLSGPQLDLLRRAMRAANARIAPREPGDENEPTGDQPSAREPGEEG